MRQTNITRVQYVETQFGEIIRYKLFLISHVLEVFQICCAWKLEAASPCCDQNPGNREQAGPCWPETSSNNTQTDQTCILVLTHLVPNTLHFYAALYDLGLCVSSSMMRFSTSILLLHPWHQRYTFQFLSLLSKWWHTLALICSMHLMSQSNGPYSPVDKEMYIWLSSASFWYAILLFFENFEKVCKEFTYSQLNRSSLYLMLRGPQMS